MNKSDVVTYFHVLATLLAIDDEVTDEETRCFQRAMQVVGLSDAQQEAAMELIDDDEMEERVSKLPLEVRSGLLKALALGALADGELHEAEDAFVKRMASAMGLGAEELEYAWNAARKRSPAFG
jgi:uncharacterized tellurite resistance protein B-like protein